MSPKPEHQLRILSDADGRKLGDKLFDRYIRREQNNFSRHPEFMLALDRLLSSFGGTPAEDEEEEEVNSVDDDQDYDDDEDIHREQSSLRRQSQNRLSRVIKKVIDRQN